MTETRAMAAAALLSLGLGVIGACSAKPADKAPGQQAPAQARPAAASGPQASAQGSMPDMPAMIPGHPPVGGGDAAGMGMMTGARANAAVQATEPIQPAPGGTKIADVWANRKALAGKSVTVRGKVVRFNGGILGRNWIHVQDGSGSAADGTNDILVTSDAAATVGDIVTVTGTVALDKDFTAGYAYAVMIENGKIELK